MPSTVEVLRQCWAAVAALGLALVFALPADTSAAQAPAFDHSTLASRALVGHIRPGYERLHAAADKLSDTMSRLCAGQATADEAARAGFDDLVVAWGRIEHIDFGPIEADKRRERILFWPDRRGLGARQVAQALSLRDTSVLDAARLAEKSVALQGIGALEIVLFGDGGLKAAPAGDREHRCRFGMAIAANMASITRQLVAGWRDEKGFAGYWLRPGEGNPVFLQPAETTLALAKAFDQGLERARDERIAGPLGVNRQRKRTPAPLGLSGRSLRFVMANVEGVRDLYDSGGLRAAISAAASNSTNDLAVADLVARELATGLGVLQPLIGHVKPFDDAKISQQLIPAGFPLKNARVLTGELLVRHAGLTLGFNASDGD